MYILGLHSSHDANASLFHNYETLCAIALERMSRKKTDGGRFPVEAMIECAAQAKIALSDIGVVSISRSGWNRNNLFPIYQLISRVLNNGQLQRKFQKLENLHRYIDTPRFLEMLGLSKNCEIFFYNHHFSHTLGALNHVTWQDGLVYCSDGGGDMRNYAATLLRNGKLKNLWADNYVHVIDRASDSLGFMYGVTTEALGFKPLRHEGKVLGLAAFGDPREAKELTKLYSVNDNGHIICLCNKSEIKAKIHDMVAKLPREDVAASVQSVLETVTIRALEKLIIPNKVRNLAVSGGVFANVKLSQKIQERFQLDELFVYPAMSDQGQSSGGCLEYLLRRDGLANWLDQRKPLENVYFGRDYSDTTARVFSDSRVIGEHNNIVERTVDALISGKTVGTYIGRMEYGPRALGARTILAQATERSINDWLNKKLERTEFMPFAPVVLADLAHEVFDIADAVKYTAGFMTITVNVKSEWRDQIPAVVHVDGTARPQIIRREQNPLYYDILKRYAERTGIPVLINTSFNVHEEPIINKPEEALRALIDNRIDYVLTPFALFRTV